MTMLWKHHQQPGTADEATNDKDELDEVHHDQDHEPQHCSERDDKLQNTLEELDNERRRTKDLEAKIAALKKHHHHQQQQQPHQTRKRRSSLPKSTPAISQKEYVALQAQVEGYRQLVDAMTTGRPAMDAAVAALARHKHPPASRLLTEPNVLPLHVVRFLELMPWHPVAQEASAVTEELYEWQVYNAEKKAWKADLPSFPTFFKALSVILPSSGGRLVDGNAKPGVWTNQDLTQRIDLRNGYFLPNTGPDSPVWKWVGGWYVDTSTHTTTTPTHANTVHDKEGWAYAREAGHFLDTGYLIPPSDVSQELAELNITRSGSLVRRRKWCRRRLLVEYPMASEHTVHYLTMKAQCEELLSTNRVLSSDLKKTEQAMNKIQTRYDKDHKNWAEERKELERRLDDLDHEAKRRTSLLERQRGPPLKHFTLITNSANSNAPKKLIDDDDETTVSECSSTSNTTSPFGDDGDEVANALKYMDKVLLLSPEHDVVKATEARKSPLNGSGNSIRAGSTSKCTPQAEEMPDVETCSDDNYSCGSLEDSERTCEDSKPVNENHKSFLQKLFSH